MPTDDTDYTDGKKLGTLLRAVVLFLRSSLAIGPIDACRCTGPGDSATFARSRRLARPVFVFCTASTLVEWKRDVANPELRLAVFPPTVTESPYRLENPQVARRP